MVTDILVGRNDNVEGVRTFFGMNFFAPSVVLTTGTFMSGKIWVGRTYMPAGRAGESASHGLTENLQQFGFETDRLKTGTPARVDSRTVDYSGLEPQHGDEEVILLNFIHRFSSYFVRHKLTAPFFIPLQAFQFYQPGFLAPSFVSLN